MYRVGALDWGCGLRASHVNRERVFEKAVRLFQDLHLPSGKRLYTHVYIHRFGKSPIGIGKSTVNHPSSIATYVKLPEGINGHVLK